MAKKGMKRIERTHTQPKNEVAPVPEIQGKARPIIAGTNAPSLKVYHSRPHSVEREISSAYKGLDTDLARDNLENHLPDADLQDL